ncbi:MAG TPA: amino acid adenylation domain-containing protein, partial [Herpetosiphonaceae bacterium]
MSHDDDIELRRAKLSLAKRAILEKRLRGELASSAKESGIPRQPRPADIPPSFAQQRLWFLDQLEPDSSTYNTFNALRLEGPLNVAALEHSLNAIVERHEVLRTTFATTPEGQPIQVIAPQQVLPLPLIDLQELPEHARDAAVQRLANEEARQPFDLARGPLIRTRLLRQDPDTHVLLLSMHHIVFDDWSHGVFMQELVALYTSFAAAQPATPSGTFGAALPIQYADYAIWQRQRLSGAVLESQLGYWKQQLADLSTLQLPTDHPRPAAFSFQGAVRPFALPKALSDELVALSRREGVTLFMTLLAAFQVLLARYSSQDDIAVGTPVAGRTRRELEGLIGFFVNTLVLRTDLAGNPTFREVLQRVRETALGADAHQDVPFEQVVEELQPARELDRHPLFQVMFALQNRPMPALELPGLKMRPLQITRTTTKFDLTLSLEQSAEGLAGWVEYSTELFEAETIGRMVGHFQTLLSGIIAQPDLRVAALPLLPEFEREQLLRLANERPAVYPQAACLHTVFAAQAARTPDAVAVTYEDTALTYAELDRRANQVAQYLRSLDVGPEVYVGICIEPSLEVIVGLLGILKAGGAYVPIDPAYPAQRQSLILADAQAPVLLTQERIAAELPESAAQIVCLDAEWPTIARLPDTPPPNAVTPDHLAYVIYTSGSTGTPKGVQVTHANAGRVFAATDDWFRFDERDVWTLFHSTAFDFSVWELWGALLYGGRLVVVPYWISRSPDAFADLLRRERVTVLNQTPSAFRQLVQAAGSAGDLPLRLVIFGGEALNLASLQSWFAYYPDRMPQLVNMYGITETTVHVTYRPLTAEDARVALGSMIGVPIPDLQLYILDQQMQPVPVGVSGELYVGGGGVARGYLNRPALTAERFVPHPFSATPGARLYKSGDGARYRANGDIEYLGRLDTQIKIRGFRIEIGEIEAVLSRYSGVRDAVVIVREDEPPAGGHPEKRLVAYVVEEQENKETREQNEDQNPERRTQNGEPRLKDESDSVPPRLPQPRLKPAEVWGRGVGGEGLILSLRAFLRTRLPEYMVPSAFVVLDAIPLTAHGKVDRRALPAPDSARPMPEDTFVAPRTADEEIVAQIWAEVLHLDRVGILDNFFVLGGHSLMATQVISKLRAAFQIELPLRVLFEVPTIAGLCERIEAARYDTAALPPPPLGPAPRDGALPLSFAQQRLWFLDQLEQDNPIYNLPFAAYLTGKLDIAALGRSLDTIVARHEVLRTTFETADHGQPAQVIAAAQPLPLPLIDLHPEGTRLPEHERDAEVRRLATEAALQPFDVARGPLLRATLLRLHCESHVLLLTMHHIIADGWSMGVFISELSALYAATVSGEAPALPVLPIQYADYAVWQRDWLQGAVLERQLNYWRQQLADLPVLELPTDYPRPPALSFRGALHRFTLPKSLSDELVALSQREGVTLFMTLLAAWQVLLSRYSGQNDIAVGTAIAGRTHAETEGLIGFFVNTLVLRADLAGNPTFSELLGRVRAVCLGAYAHQDLPFEQVVEELQPARDLSRHPLFQVMFTLQNALVAPLELPDLKVDPFVVDHGLVKFDLSLEFEETASGLAGMLAYNTDLFTVATIERMLGHLAMLLGGIVAAVDQPL